MSFKESIARLLNIEPTVKEVVNWRDREVEKIKLVEVPVLRTQSGWNRELRETVATLASHPGFVALTDRLALQAASLKAKLAADRHPTLRDVEFIQSGIFWCNWLQNQVAAATTRTAVRRQDAADEDIAAIKEIEATYAKVGE